MGASDAEYSDVLIIGAGISGIGAAYRIHERNPQLTYTILERRERIGGTWDLFRYPGIRSDSDIFTLSFTFEPWTREENVAEGEYERLTGTPLVIVLMPTTRQPPKIPSITGFIWLAYRRPLPNGSSQTKLVVLFSG